MCNILFKQVKKGDEMKKIITLFSLDKESYQDIQVEVDVIQDVSNKIEEIAQEKELLAIKKAVVKARKAKCGEIVDTRPRVMVNGRVYTFSETKHIVTQLEENNGAMVVVNPHGEEYIINTFEKFYSRYEKTDNGYLAIEGVKKFRKSKGNYVINTSWGEEQIVLKDSYFCVQNSQDIYGITNIAFELTYETEPKQVELISKKIQNIKNKRELQNNIQTL